MLILGVESSSALGSIALAKVDSSVQLLAKLSWRREKSLGEHLTVALQQLLQEANADIQDLDEISVDVGPGSFTGLRAGINLARALGYSCDLPVWPVSSLRLLAEPWLPSGKPVLTLIHAFRDLLYVAYFRRTISGVEEVWPARAVTVAELSRSLPSDDFVVAGDGWGSFLDQWPETVRDRVQIPKELWPEAHQLFPIIVESRSRGIQPSLWQNVIPLYIRGSEAEEKLRQGLLKPVSKA